jgi:hypothetical protein
MPLVLQQVLLALVVVLLVAEEVLVAEVHQEIAKVLGDVSLENI